ncbi:hypothetical protein ACFC6L_34795 [Kitasatospora phosalacinea]|uniref:hypothetical protein n=1 Tax=Kitasatospora phosalacinea TaxID=2065 RepID=UPI0035E20FF0
MQTWFKVDALSDTNRCKVKADQQLWVLPGGGKVLAALAHARCDLVTFDDGPQRLILAIAVALEHQRTPLRLGDSAIECALATIRASEPADLPVLVIGKIDTRNKPSIAMVTRAGFENIDEITDYDGSQLGVWTLLV